MVIPIIRDPRDKFLDQEREHAKSQLVEPALAGAADSTARGQRVGPGVGTGARPPEGNPRSAEPVDARELTGMSAFGGEAELLSSI